MEEQEKKPSESLEVESITPDDLSTEDLEDASGGAGGVTCGDLSCKAFSGGE